MKQHSKTSLFLMELILSILLFSICSAVCVRLFAFAYQKHEQANALSAASQTAQSIAACLQAGKDPQALPSFFPALLRTADGYSAYFDQDFEDCDKKDAAYQLQICFTDGSPARADITIRTCREETTLFDLTVSYGG